MIYIFTNIKKAEINCRVHSTRAETQARKRRSCAVGVYERVRDVKGCQRRRRGDVLRDGSGGRDKGAGETDGIDRDERRKRKTGAESGFTPATSLVCLFA